MSGTTPDVLRVHGDRYTRPGMLDFAVNIWPSPRPPRLRTALTDALQGAAYPDETSARRAIARRHRRPAEQVLALSGACEAFWLLAHALPVRHAVCVHPSFTEAEAALRAAGRPLTRIIRGGDGWRLDPQQVPEQADLVVLANPNNPTGNLDPPEQIARMARDGRTLLVDESFIDFVADEQASLADANRLPGLLVLRSLTKSWGLAGVRAGYLLGPAEIIARLGAHRQPWSVSSPALAAIEVCVGDRDTPARIAAEVSAARADLHARLEQLPEVKVWPARANFLLIEVPDGAALAARLEAERIAVRPCHSFPGLTPDHIRLAVRTPTEHARLTTAIARAMSEPPDPRVHVDRPAPR